MTLAYTKWSAEEDKKRNLLDDGLYSSTIIAIEEKLTQGGRFNKNGEPIPQMKMLVVDFVLNIGDRERKMKSWVMLEGDMSWQFRHLCQACNLLDKYEQDCVETKELLGRKPILDIKIRNQKDRDGNDVTRNVINDYMIPMKAKPSSLTPLSKPKNDFIDDDIPI